MEWKSIKDRLPEEINTIKYLVSDGKDVCIAAYDVLFWNNKDGQEWGWIFDGKAQQVKVKYWMEIPPPPKR